MTNFKLILILITVTIFLFFQKQKNIACNNSNSIAEKINFANKNCLKK